MGLSSNVDKNPIIGNSFNPSLFKKISEENLLALVGDSTNANVSGSSGSEKDVQEHLKNLFSRYDKRIVITCFSSNISRLQSIADAAKKNNRHIAVLGRSLKRMIETAIECGYLKNLTNIVSEDEIHRQETEIQTLTDKHVTSLNEMQEFKEKELLDF